MKKNNKGYTLIEVIIVIAIMAILSGMAFVTLGIVKKAKMNAAVESFDNQISSLQVQTKAVSQAGQPASSDLAKDVADGVDQSTYQYVKSRYPLCMYIYKNKDDDSAVVNGDLRAGSYSIYFGYNVNGKFVNGNSNQFDKDIDKIAITLTEAINIVYTPPAGSNQEHQEVIANPDNILIEFNKSDGSLRYGGGTYTIQNAGNNERVATLYLDSVTGNHYIK
ncbi:MAG: prepilin-type N-terminal cleavage/methylation domain-containing protein [Lachnospiraceae bacterium]